jgi:hypothetical protein
LKIKAKTNDSSIVYNKKNNKVPLSTIKEKESVISNKYEDFHSSRANQNLNEKFKEKFNEKASIAPKNRDKSKDNDERTKKVYFSDKKQEEVPKKTKIFNNFSNNVNDYMQFYNEKPETNSTSSVNNKPIRFDLEKSSNASRSLATQENEDNLSRNYYGKSPAKSSSRGGKELFDKNLYF